MSASLPFFRLDIAIAMAMVLAVWFLWPAESSLMRKLAAVAVSVAMGFHIARAIGAKGGITKNKAWLECLGFPLVISSFVYLPAMFGWFLLLSGWAWRFMVGNLWK